MVMGSHGMWWFQIFFSFTPILGEDEPILTHIFETGWNHQPDKSMLIFTAVLFRWHTPFGYTPSETQLSYIYVSLLFDMTKTKDLTVEFLTKTLDICCFFLMTSCPDIQGFHIVWVGSIRAPVMPHFSFKKIFKVRTDASFVWHDAATSRERQT